jgi:hypothetical protein
MNLEIYAVGLITNRPRESNSIKKNLTDSVRCYVNANKIETHVTLNNIYIYIYIKLFFFVFKIIEKRKWIAYMRVARSGWGWLRGF